MSGRRMTTKDAIMLSGVLGLAVLGLLLLVLKPFSGFERELPENVGKTASMPAVNATEKPGGTADDETSASGAAILLNTEGKTLEKRVHTPAGYKRKEADSKSLTTFLREYPLKKAGSKVRLYNGKKKENQDAHAAVFKLPLEKENLQQCADSVMRVYAEYYWKTEQKEKISFRFVDGFQADYVRWREGYRIQTGATRSSWVSSGAYDDSYKNFQKYMRMVFAYASTISMKAESKKIKLSKIQVGDIFLKDGSPGHVVMVVDICENEDGKKAFLLGQGYMPAQEFHLLKNPAHEEDPWYYETEISYPLETPEYTFEKGCLRRLNY